MTSWPHHNITQSRGPMIFFGDVFDIGFGGEGACGVRLITSSRADSGAFIVDRAIGWYVRERIFCKPA
jgi:hypothetical protein